MRYGNFILLFCVAVSVVVVGAADQPEHDFSELFEVPENSSWLAENADTSVTPIEELIAKKPTGMKKAIAATPKVNPAPVKKMTVKKKRPAAKAAKAKKAHKVPLKLTRPQRVKDTHFIKIKTPALKSRKTRKLILGNRMKVYIISDNQLSQSAAAVTNADGSWQNPNEALGLAHFVEHMEFMGTKRHPRPSSFDTFLEDNGAELSNAATMSQETQFGFSVAHNAFAEALSRFSDLFTMPLFSEKGLHKEINAVNSEYEMHKGDDTWRQLFVMKETANPKHPYSRFSIGTLKTLGKVDHKFIKKWYKAHYSANLMAATVYTALPLDAAEKLVNEHFSKIPDRNLPLFKVKVPMQDPKREGTVVWQKSIAATHSLEMQWELPKHLGQRNPRNAFQRPDRLLAHIINYTGKDSLFQELKRQHLAHSVSAGRSDKGFDYSGMSISLSLTPKGMKQWRKVVGLVYQSLAKVNKTGVPKHIFDVIKTTDLSSVQWQQRTVDVFNTAMSHSTNIASRGTDFASYPFVDDVLQEYDPKGVHSLISALTPAKAHMYVLSSDFPPELKNMKTHTEPYYKSQYKTFRIAAKTLKKWASQAQAPATFLKIPPMNPYLPKHLHVTKNLMANPPKYPALPKPVKVLDSPRERLHVWEDRMFGDPYAAGGVTIKTNKKFVGKYGVDAVVQISLLVSCLNHILVSELHPFFEAGITWSLSASTGTNLYMGFSGTNPEPAHYRAVMKIIANTLKKAADGKLASIVNKKTFESIKTQMLHSLQNSLKSDPVQVALRTMNKHMVSTSFPIQDQISATKRADFTTLTRFVPMMLSESFYTGLFHGQVTAASAKKTFSQIVEIMSPRTKILPKSAHQETLLRNLPNRKQYDVAHGSYQGYSAVLLIDAGGLSCKEREALSFLYKAVPMRFYNDLRSKQQTGYVVQTTISVPQSHHDMLYFIVQSSKYLPGDLLNRYQVFIASMLKDINSGKSSTMSQKQFNMIKKSKVDAFKTPNQSVMSMGTLMSTLMENYNSDFRTMEKKLAITKAMTYSDVLAVARKVFSPKNKQQLAVLYAPYKSKAKDVLKKLPTAFLQFKNHLGKMKKKPRYSCNVKLPSPQTKPKKILAVDHMSISRHGHSHQGTKGTVRSSEWGQQEGSRDGPKTASTSD